MNAMHATTILLVRRNNQVVIASDGQITLGSSVMKNNAEKTRWLHNNTVLAGFAGSTADALTLFEHFELQLKKHPGNITRAAVELTKAWRTEKRYMQLEAMLIVSDINTTLILSGNGDVIEPEHPIVAIGSGGNFAQAAAVSLYENTKLSAKSIVEKSMKIAADICIYTNHQISCKTLEKQKNV